MKKNDNTNILYWIIALLALIVIGWLGYFLGQNGTTNDNEKQVETEVTIITADCWVKCDTKQIEDSLKQIALLSNTEFNIMNFDTDKIAKTIYEDSKLQFLPAVLFSDNSITQISDFLTITDSWLYNLNIWATYDPNAEPLDVKAILWEIKKDSYIEWNKDATITWIDYSDLECPYCAKVYSNWTPDALKEKYWEDINFIFQSFPLAFHKNAEIGALIIECLGKEKWSEWFYGLIKKSFDEKNSNKDFLIKEAIKLWANEKSLNKCVEDKEFLEKIEKQASLWTEKFWITGTPWNVIINNKTWEYEIVSWALPTSNFIQVIDWLLK